MKIYTKTGDDGTTGLFNGERVTKYNDRVEAYGTIDELNSILGIAISHLNNSKIEEINSPHKENIKTHLTQISNLLFNLGSDLATPLFPPPKFDVPRITVDNITILENWIDDYDTNLEKLRAFILPGGGLSASFLHQARTVCRRAERQIVKLSKDVELNPNTVVFVNRLSDYLFTAARYSNFIEGIEDIFWVK
jgi:cob(I)alamin adenosyltransferase